LNPEAGSGGAEGAESGPDVDAGEMTIACGDDDGDDAGPEFMLD